ncbi:OLC1v1012027C1 [Oldenlandia corymbosa var. corymbosa]|uniref:OLC1v1012027C1 n=1 Tax=Oldenlandia corymbosa var. corymbosa TaxID=529605 RepID=A0AAV1DYH5_OLDCO|nr:OLC1v1012027C1 [Oldenlandia corymbosa var. corymbosa]
MGRGVSSGGGQSSLGYLFGNGEAPQPTAPTTAEAAPKAEAPPAESNVATRKAAGASPPAEPTKRIPAGIQGGNMANNYHRADGQNSGNFLTDRPSTKVHAAPGGGSSLGYLFGGNN